MLSLRFYLPHPGLRDCISTYYALDVGDVPIDDRLLPEWANVRFSIEGSWAIAFDGTRGPLQRATDASLFGPTGRAARITGAAGSRLFGFGILPNGWARLVQTSARPFVDKVLPLDTVMGVHAGRWLDALRHCDDDAARVRRMDRLLLTTLRSAPPAGRALPRVHGALVAQEFASVGAFAREVGMSERTLERFCGRMFGFTAKPLLRRQRFLRTLEQILRHPGRPLSESIGGSYADQPHFVREFRAFMGPAPTAYLAEPRNLMRLAAIERERAIGQMMQGLHHPPG